MKIASSPKSHVLLLTIVLLLPGLACDLPNAPGGGPPEGGSYDYLYSNKNPQIAMDGKGNAMTVWLGKVRAIGESNLSLHARPYGSGATWEVLPWTETSNEDLEHHVAMDETGSVIAVRAIYGDPIWAYRYDPVSGAWAGPAKIEDVTRGGEPYVAMDGSGAATVVWQQNNSLEGLEPDVYACRYVGGIWEAPERIGRGMSVGSGNSEPQVTAFRDGANGVTENENPATYTYAYPGDYEVVLQVMDDEGNRASLTQTITVTGGEADPCAERVSTHNSLPCVETPRTEETSCHESPYEHCTGVDAFYQCLIDNTYCDDAGELVEDIDACGLLPVCS